MNVLAKLDASISLSDDEQTLLASLQSVIRDRIAPRAAQIDASGEFPTSNVAAINELGLNSMFVPADYGGAALSYLSYLVCVREISKACASTGIIWATNFHAMKPLIDFGSQQQKERWLPRIAEGALGALCITEESAGSDATGMKTMFRLDGDHVVIDGGKIFITNGDVADLYLVFGKWQQIEDPKKAITALILEKGTPGLSVVRKEDKMGHRGSSTVALSFQNCRVPVQNVLGSPGGGLPLLLASLNKSRPSVAAHALGIARAAFEDAVGHINARRQFGKRIVEFQGIQFMLADMATDLAMCESWLWRLGAHVDAGATDFGVEASMVKMRASDLAMRITTDAVQLFGGSGYCKGTSVERYMRDAKVTQIWEGTNQIHRQLIGRSFIQR